MPKNILNNLKIWTVRIVRFMLWVYGISFLIFVPYFIRGFIETKFDIDACVQKGDTYRQCFERYNQ